MRENGYQRRLILKLRRRFRDCVILKLDPEYVQGIPDLLILWRDCWAVLEVKASARAAEQPNQRYYVEQLNDMSFAAFIYPSIEEEVLDALQQAFESRRAARVS